MKYIIGVDEVGRGPLAGPVTVGVVVCEAETYKKLKRRKDLPPAGKDSKKLSPQLRQNYVEVLNDLKIPRQNIFFGGFARSTDRDLRKIAAAIYPYSKKDILAGNFFNYSIIHISNKIIDTKGLSFSIKTAMRQGIEKLKLNPAECEVRLDGGLHAPAEFKNQKTIIKGDEKEKIIAWASILAKVSRDALMCKAAKKYSEYGFEIHKGYGTARHCSAISKHGLSSLHRKTFCRKFSAKLP